MILPIAGENKNIVEPPVSDHPKMLSLGGRLRELASYESLNDTVY